VDGPGCRRADNLRARSRGPAPPGPARVSLRVDYDERAIDQAAAFPDDPPGIRAILDAIDRLANDRRPAGSFPYGSPDLRRLRVGRYRILYEITDDTIAIRHTARATGN
jgi:mRNA interferase RelE/StbE